MQLLWGHLYLLPWMACMQALQEQKPVTKKSELIEAPLDREAINHEVE